MTRKGNTTLSCFIPAIFIHLLTDEQLHVVELEPAELEKCEDISEVSANTICTKAKEDNGKCLVRNFFKEFFGFFI